MPDGTTPNDAIVIGAGLAGLAAAAYLARAGRSVALLERSSLLGGRGITTRHGEFEFNLGPHAVYRAGAGRKVLDELGIKYTGKTPPTSGYGILDGKLAALSSTPWWLLRTPLLRGLAKLEIVRLTMRIPTLDPHAFRNTSVSDFLDTRVRRPDARRLAEALIRVSSYSNDTERTSAEVAVQQLKLATRNVLYLDHGWQTLVDGLRGAIEDAGGRIVTGAKAVAVERDASVRGVRLDDGTLLSASAVIVAATPDVAADVTGDETLREQPPAVRMATLDVGLRSLPRPSTRFSLGLDIPTYFSVHSTVAQLGPEGSAMVHIAKYLPTGDTTDAKETERQLEGVLDLMQPGWRDVLAERRFLPDMTVVAALATAERGGLAGRTPVETSTRGLFLAGDWTGDEGWLSDASLASGKKAAELASAWVGTRNHEQGTRSRPAAAVR